MLPNLGNGTIKGIKKRRKKIGKTWGKVKRATGIKKGQESGTSSFAEGGGGSSTAFHDYSINSGTARQNCADDLVAGGSFEENFRILTKFYEICNPAKVGEVQTILSAYAGREEELFERLHDMASTMSNAGPEGHRDSFDSIEDDLWEEDNGEGEWEGGEEENGEEEDGGEVEEGAGGELIEPPSDDDDGKGNTLGNALTLEERIAADAVSENSFNEKAAEFFNRPVPPQSKDLLPSSGSSQGCSDELFSSQPSISVEQVTSHLDDIFGGGDEVKGFQQEFENNSLTASFRNFSQEAKPLEMPQNNGKDGGAALLPSQTKVVSAQQYSTLQNSESTVFQSALEQPKSNNSSTSFDEFSIKAMEKVRKLANIVAGGALCASFERLAI